jgi:hypothetical protein
MSRFTGLSRSPRSRARLLVELTGVLLGLGLAVTSLVWLVGTVRGSGDTPRESSALTSSAPTLPPAPYGPCDDAPADDGDCRSQIPLLEELSYEGAVARFLAGSPWPEDVQFLLLGDADWEVLFGGVLDDAYRVPGAVIPAGGLPPGIADDGIFAFQEEWRGEGFALVQQALVFATEGAAQAALGAWASASVDAGLPEVDLAEVGLGAGELGPGAFTTAFVDPQAVGFFADRRCAVRTGVVAREVVLIVTFFEGDGCASARLAPAPMAAEGLRNRILGLAG